jgi:hypothetical protein
MVMLTGRRNGTTHKAVELLESLPIELRLIGGLAVMCRVGTPHRATVDLDAVARDLPLVHEAIARLAVTAPGGGQYTFANDFDLDVIDVAPSSTRVLIDQLLDHDEPLGDLDLNMIAHTWAHDTATPLDVVAIEDGTGEVLARADGRLVASSVGLVAMKATTVPLRSSSRPEKRASDLYDLGRLIVVGNLGSDDLGEMPEELRTAVVERLRHWFVDPGGRDRTFREVRRFDEPRLDLDEVADAVEPLTP